MSEAITTRRAFLVHGAAVAGSAIVGCTGTLGEIEIRPDVDGAAAGPDAALSPGLDGGAPRDGWVAPGVDGGMPPVDPSIDGGTPPIAPSIDGGRAIDPLDARTLPTWSIAPEPYFLVGDTRVFDLAATLPAGIARGGVFSVDPSGAPLPAGMTLSPAGVLSAGTAVAAITSGVVLRYEEP